MLISYKKIVEKYNLKIKNILHIGAHQAEEKADYFNNGCESVIWVEGNSELAANLKNTIADEKNIVLEAVISNIDNRIVQFKLTNNGQSSSILNLGIHKNLFPDIVVNRQFSTKTITIKTLFKQNKLDLKQIDFINLDIQGAELLALQGMGDDIEYVNAIFTEINTDYVYENCALVEQIDRYLSFYSFKRVETVMYSNHPWGDALYIKQ